jgi:hypothetical protein
MSLAVSTLRESEQLKFYEITGNMDSAQSECLSKLLGLRAREVSNSGGNIARELADWIRQHVLSKLEDNYCNLLQTELKKKTSP